MTHVAIDGRAISDPQRSGYKTYSQGLLKALLSVPRGQTYTVYTDRPSAAMSQELSNANVTVVIAPPLLGLPIREQILVPRRLRKDRADVAHFTCNTMPLHSSIPSVVTIHDLIQLDAWRSDKSLTPRQRAVTYYSALALRRGARRARVVITVSNETAKQLRMRLGISPQRLRVIYSAPRPIYTASGPADCRPEGTERSYILGVGSSGAHKNVNILLRAYALLPTKLKRCVALVLVCANQTTARVLSKSADELGVVATFLTNVDDAQLAGLFRGATLFVFPSSQEGFGLPVLEAMACGAPVVAARASAIPEIAGGAALLCAPGDPVSLAQGLQSVCEDPALRRALVDLGLKNAARFSWERCASETAAVYEDARRSLAVNG